MLCSEFGNLLIHYANQQPDLKTPQLQELQHHVKLKMMLATLTLSPWAQSLACLLEALTTTEIFCYPSLQTPTEQEEPEDVPLVLFRGESYLLNVANTR